MEDNKKEETVKYRANGREIEILPETKEFLDKVTIKPYELEEAKRQESLQNKDKSAE